MVLFFDLATTCIFFGIFLYAISKEWYLVAKKLFGKVLVTQQTGTEGKEVKRIYVQKAYDISNELYLSCLVDRQSGKIAFISSTEGGVDIELVAKNTPKKILTTK